MHRVAEALSEGRTSISAVQFEVTPKPDWRSAQALYPRAVADSDTDGGADVVSRHTLHLL